VPLTPQRESVWDYPRPPRVEAVTDRMSNERRDALVQQVGSGAAPLLGLERDGKRPPTTANDLLIYG
jgi:hypothetical protein